jgi:hypothetical protein
MHEVVLRAVMAAVMMFTINWSMVFQVSFFMVKVVLRFKVQGSKFKVQDSGFRFQVIVFVIVIVLFYP